MRTLHGKEQAMAQRINISVKDDLYERLQAFRDSINVSRICQEAITAEVQEKEDFRKRMNETPDMEDIIARLRRQSREGFVIVREKGIKDGEDWAKTAHYDDLFEAVDNEGLEINIGDNGYELPPEIVEYLFEKNAVKAQIADVIEYLNVVLPDLKIRKHNHDELNSEYTRGWYKGVVDFWDEIKDAI